jgi:hypothetical protein
LPRPFFSPIVAARADIVEYGDEEIWGEEKAWVGSGQMNSENTFEAFRSDF